MKFPIEKIPARARDAIEAQAALGNYPLESVGPSALAIMSHAAQGLYNVDSLQVIGKTYPLSQLFMVLARSGDAKSSVFSALMDGVKTWQKRMGELHDHLMLEYEVEKRYHDKRRAAVEKDKDATREDRLDVERSKPMMPMNPWNTLSKVTTNGIYDKLEKGYPTLGIFSGEGGSFLGGHSLKKENGPVEMASAMTQLWDGDSIDRTTGEVTMRLHGRRLSGLIMVQPEVATAFLSDPVLKPHGVHARFLVSSPPAWEQLDLDFTDVGEIKRRERLASRLEAFCQRIEDLLDEALPTSERDMRELTPPTLYWTPAAQQHMRAFQTRSIELRQEEETFFKRTFEHACRMAGVLTVFEGHDKIGLEAAEAATALIEFYADQWRKLDVQPTDERDQRLSGYIDRVLKFMRGKSAVTMRELSRNPLQRIDIKVREAVLDSMLRDGLIEAEEVELGMTKTMTWKLAA